MGTRCRQRESRVAEEAVVAEGIAVQNVAPTRYFHTTNSEIRFIVLPAQVGSLLRKL